jgi:flagellar biosynthetic protein FliR
MVDWASLTLFLYITARISGCILFNPILGRRNIPRIFRSGMVLVLSVFVASTTEQTVQVPTVTLDLVLHILLELALGAVLGLVVSFFFYIPQLAGTVTDTQMGMTMNQIYDTGAQANMSVTGEMLNVLMMLLFFAANGHHTMLRIMLTSGEIVPFGGVHLGTQAMEEMLQLFIECTVLGV